MSLLVIVPTLDLNSTFGAAPYVNQLVNALQTSTETKVFESKKYRIHLTHSLGRFRKTLQKLSTFTSNAFNKYSRHSLQKLNLDPTNILIISDYSWLKKENSDFLRKTFNAKLYFYDLEIPLNLPENCVDKRYGPSIWRNHDLTEMNGTVIPSLGAAPFVREQLGCQNVKSLYFSVDPAWYELKNCIKNWDVGFFGLSTYYREHYIEEFIVKPSLMRANYKFVVVNRRPYDFGNAEVLLNPHFKLYVSMTQQARINLNITRSPFTSIYASSVSRPFELGAMKSCVISNPCVGLEEWFEVGKEVLVAESSKDVIELYGDLLNDGEKCKRLGENMYRRVLRDHTVHRRAKELLEFMK